MPPTCIDCNLFDHEAKRSEKDTLVRCFEVRNKDGLWFHLVKAGTPQCRHFRASAPTEGETK